MRRFFVTAWLITAAGCSLGSDLGDLTDQKAGSAGAGGSAGVSGAGGAAGQGGATAGQGGGSAGQGSQGAAGAGGMAGGGNGAGGDAPLGLRFVQSSTSTTDENSTSLKAVIAPTNEGNLVVVAVTLNSNAAATVVSIDDDAQNTYVSTGKRSVNPDCTDAIEIWYAKNVRAGAKTVNVVADRKMDMDMWAVEFAGLSPTEPFDVGDTINQQPADTPVNAPLVEPSTPDAVIVSAVSTCGGIDGIRAGNPFTALNIVSQNNTAFFIAHEPGAYGAAWDAYDTWTSTTVAFK